MLAKEWWTNVRSYLRHHHVGLIGIIITLLVLRGVETLKTEEILLPVVVFNRNGDENKEAPTVTGDKKAIKDFKNYGKHGLLVEWSKKAEEPLELVWKLKRKNYDERHNYFFYFRVKAKKRQTIAVTLVDDKERFTQIHLEVSDQITRTAISLAREEFNKYYKTRKEVDESGKVSWVSIPQDDFNWESVERIEIAAYEEEKIENRILFEKVLLFIAS